jgi:transcription termination factor Rho
MAVLDRAELEASPLADLHAIAREMGIDGYRLLPREELITAILAGGAVTARDLRERAAAVRDDDLEPLATTKPRRRASRSRTQERRREQKSQEQPSREGGLKGGEVVEGKLTVRQKGGGELQVERDGRTYKVLIAPSQIKRFELKDGDLVAGPIRRRKGAGFALVRVERINGTAAEEAVAPPPRKAKGPSFPERLLALPGGDPLLAEVEAFAPLGFGSRALVVGPTRSGKSELLQRIAKALAAAKEPKPIVVLAGVRPEELAGWQELGVELAAQLTLAATEKERLAALQSALSTAEGRQRKGEHVAVLIDTLDGLAPEQCRQILAKARNEPGKSSLTVIATAAAPFGGETTVIALQGDLDRPQLDPQQSGTLKVELLVGEQRAGEIARERQRRLRRRGSLLSRLFGR